MIFATDLDNTMIFSCRKLDNKQLENIEYVEYYNGKYISCMTKTSIAKLNKLKKKIMVIPVTTRSIEQFERVKYFSSDIKYAVVDNGGTILQNGRVHKEWDQYIDKILHKYDFQEVFKIFLKLPDLISNPRVIDGKFIYTKSNNVDLCKQILQCELDTNIWQLSFQNSKVYAIPKEITKGMALKFIKQELIKDNKLLISAGDSNLDISMLEFADIGIIPKDSDLSKSSKTEHFIKLGTGIDSTDIILNFVYQKSFAY